MRMPPRGLGLLARFLFVCALLLFPGMASAFTPPSPQGAVTDTSGHLTASDDQMLEAHLAAYRARTTNEIDVLMLGSLGGESIDDVAYDTFNEWGVGKKGKDNGVLLVIAPNERKMRIETGKGIGDKLTDLQSSRILRERVGPMLKENRFLDAIVLGVDAIEAALDERAPQPLTGGKPSLQGGELGPRTAPAPATPVHAPSPSSAGSIGFLVFLMFGGVFMGFVVLAIVIVTLGSRRRRGGGSSSSGNSWSSGSSYSSGDSYSSGSSGGSDWGGSSGSSGGSDFGGGGGGGSDFGGGSSGGGGSSDSY